MNSKFFILFAIPLILAVSFNNVYAVNSIDWTYGGYGPGFEIAPGPGIIPSASSSVGFLSDLPFTVLVDASDEGTFTTNGIIDTIDVTVTSVNDPNVITYTLTETGINDGIFTGTSFVFLKGNFQFQITDTVDLTYTIDSSAGCNPDGIIQQLDSTGGGGDGFIVYSETDDLTGVGLVLTETGADTCEFLGQVQFTTGPSSDETTGTLQVSEGDILEFDDQYDAALYNAQIIPTVTGKGSIIANFDGDDDTYEVTVTYNGLLQRLNLQDDGAGSGGGTGGAIVRPGLVLNFIVTLLGGGSSNPSPPTLGLNENQKRIVDGGFSFNGNPVDVQQFYTPYPLITTEVGKLNTIKLKIYDNNGLDNISHVGLSYGLGKGEIFNEGRATIEYDRTFDDMEHVTIFDPKHVLGSVNVTTTTTNCSILSKDMCLEVTFDHIFRESLDYNMVATNIWDFNRNGWQNYFNHGIEIIGESMNPPEEYSGIYRGHIYHLTETGKNTAIDDDGNYWTFDKIWNRDYIKPVIVDNDLLNPNKVIAIEQLGFQYSDALEIFGFDRMDHRFIDSKNQQQIEALHIMSSICPECQKEPFEKINDIFSYDTPIRYSKLDDPKIVTLKNLEDKKAQEFLKQYFEKLYSGRIHD